MKNNIRGKGREKQGIKKKKRKKNFNEEFLTWTAI